MHGVPSWKSTFGRTVIVQAVLSALGVTDSARYGSQAPWALMMVNGSKTVRAYITPTSSNRAVVGLNPDSSASTPNTNEPPFLGVAFEMPFRPGPLVEAAPATPSPRRTRRQAGRRGGSSGEQRATIERLGHRPSLPPILHHKTDVPQRTPLWVCAR